MSQRNPILPYYYYIINVYLLNDIHTRRASEGFSSKGDECSNDVSRETICHSGARSWGSVARRDFWTYFRAALVIPTVLPQLKEGPGRVTLPLDGADNVSRALTILMILLALTIAGREIPEMSKLADDPSNDGQIVDLYAEALPRPVSQRANTTKALPTSKRGFVFSSVFSSGRDCSSRPALATNGQQLLLFLTIQRT